MILLFVIVVNNYCFLLLQFGLKTNFKFKCDFYDGLIYDIAIFVKNTMNRGSLYDTSLTFIIALKSGLGKRRCKYYVDNFFKMVLNSYGNNFMNVK